MVILGLFSIVVLTVLGGVFLVLSRRWTVEAAFARVAWMPLAALVVEGLAFGWLTERLSYFAVAIPVLTCVVSLFLTSVGTTLLVSSRQRGEQRPDLVRATVLASVPGALLAAYVAYAVVTAALGDGA